MNLVGRPSTRLARIGATDAWFRRHLRGDGAGLGARRARGTGNANRRGDARGGAPVRRVLERVLTHPQEEPSVTVKVFQVDRGAELEPYDVERRMIEAAGGELIVENCQSEDEVIAKAGDAEIFWVSWEPYMSRRVMEALPNCRLVVRWGVGYDQIPVRDATELGRRRRQRARLRHRRRGRARDLAPAGDGAPHPVAPRGDGRRRLAGDLGRCGAPHEGPDAGRDRRRADRERSGTTGDRPRHACHRLRQVPAGGRAVGDGRRTDGLDGRGARAERLRHDPRAAQRRDTRHGQRADAGEAASGGHPRQHVARPGRSTRQR